MSFFILRLREIAMRKYNEFFEYGLIIHKKSAVPLGETPQIFYGMS